MSSDWARPVHEGFFWGIVVSTQDPEQRQRITCRVPDVLGKTVSEWAEPDSLVISKLKAGDKVWVRFRHSDLRYPVYHVPFDQEKRGTLYNAEDYLKVRHPKADALYGGKSSVVHLFGGKVHCQSGPDGGGYVPCVASDFQIGSDPALKHDVRPVDFDPVKVIQDAPARLWKYIPAHSGDQRDRIGPMLDDLPDVAKSGENVNVNALLGILWEAVYQQSRRIESLEDEIAALKSE